MSINRYEGKSYFDKSIPLNVLLKAIDEVNVLVKDQRAFGTTIEKYDGRKLSQSDWTHAVVQFAYWTNPYCKQHQVNVEVESLPRSKVNLEGRRFVPLYNLEKNNAGKITSMHIYGLAINYYSVNEVGDTVLHKIGM